MKNMKATELKELAKELKVKNWWLLKKAELIEEIEKVQKVEEVKEEEEQYQEGRQTGLDPQNLITLKEICSELKVKGMKARRILRNAKIDRPYKRWEWNKNLHTETIKKVRELLKK